MKVFLAGATGVIGRRLLPKLIADGHDVVGTTRSARKAADLRTAGAEPVVVDALDRAAVVDAVVQARPEIVIHQLTGLADFKSLKRFDEEYVLTNRLRTEGVDNLLEGAVAAGARRLIAQSFGGWPYERTGTGLKTEDDRLDPDPVPNQRQSHDAIRHLEQVVTEAEGIEGIVLRYAAFYGPGTGFDVGGDMIEAVRGRKLPIIGNGAGVLSFVHLDDAATATIAAMERGTPGIYNIVDDDPAPVSVVFPELARILGAKPPRKVPAWVGRLVVGEVGVATMTEVRGMSNEKAKRELGWQPQHKTWRDGFRTGLSQG